MLMFWEHHAGEPFEAADQFTRLTFVSFTSWLAGRASGWPVAQCTED